MAFASIPGHKLSDLVGLRFKSFCPGAY